MTVMRNGSHQSELCPAARQAGASLQTSEAADMRVLLSYACPDLWGRSCMLMTCNNCHESLAKPSGSSALSSVCSLPDALLLLLQYAH